MDKEGNLVYTNINDPRVASGEFVGATKGKTGNCSWKGRKHKQESKEKIGKANSRYQKGEGNSQYGKKRSEEFKLNMREKFAVKFFVYDLEDNFICEAQSINEFAKTHGLNASAISKVLRGKQPYHKGYKFLFPVFPEAL